MHIVSTLIKPDGKRIGTHKIESTKSLPICRGLELKYGLIKAEKKMLEQNESVQTSNPLKVIYGKHETKRGITNFLDAVIDQYKYTSLEELNAILKQFNVIADRGPKEGVVYQSGSLYYRVLNIDGDIMGKPIKASSIYSKPTLKYLEQRFSENKLARIPLKSRIKTAIDWQMRTNPKITLPELIEQLKGEKIQVVLRHNDQHLIYGITYIDFRNRVVFNGSDLGKPYAANGLLERIGRQIPVQQVAVNDITPSLYQAEFPRLDRSRKADKQHYSSMSERHKSSKAVYPGEYLPFELKNNKKKRKRKRIR